MVQRLHLFLAKLGNKLVPKGYFFHTHGYGSMVVLCHTDRGAIGSFAVKKICNCWSCK